METGTGTGVLRLFAALLPPEGALDELARVVAPLHALPGAGQLRWTERRNWHLTLAFYERVEAPDELDELCTRLERAAARNHAWDLRLAGGGHFGDRALWAGVEQRDEPSRTEAGRDEPDRAAAGRRGRGGDPLRRLADASAAAGRRTGIDMGGSGHGHRRFHAHVTVAHSRNRPRPRTDLAPYAAALDAFRGEAWTADELALVRSHLPVSGVPGEQPRYERLVGWPLGG